jgi:hypothetical protein
MMKKLKSSLLFTVPVILFFSCTVSRVYPLEYYEQNKETMHDIEDLYKRATSDNLIAVAFSDLDFNAISLEFKTDTVRYIYDFHYNESRVNDSLVKFGYDTVLVQRIIADMRKIKCSWVNTLDYYVDGNKKRLLFLSAPVKQFSILPAFQKRKYYLFNFYRQPQYYDAAGRLLDKKRVRRLRKINNEVFFRINDKVCYTVSEKFR